MKVRDFVDFPLDGKSLEWMVQMLPHAIKIFGPATILKIGDGEVWIEYERDETPQEEALRLKKIRDAEAFDYWQKLSKINLERNRLMIEATMRDWERSRLPDVYAGSVESHGDS